jgi:4-aminobutyrate aminotransferase
MSHFDLQVLIYRAQGGTYAGNAVACAAAVATTKAIKEENILDNVNARSKELFAALNDLKSSVGKNIVEVRGQGLMVAVEFASPQGSAHDVLADPDAPKAFASRVTKKVLEKGMLLLGCSVYEVSEAVFIRVY